ncbi:putative quinol monooxygenase [Dongia rigui]|uniref:Antibiotic biosynthesis monooxygenase n=1 Tax=Dongia rigui TaxID=940149 RepID=A0ABU5DWC0_9PROT|nr:antibiotic biosynthesis monooxygenase [Dongia rigui]MDY0871513.1 antibiotic biosynthesis monooxygenase [Dongia rigui]
MSERNINHANTYASRATLRKIVHITGKTGTAAALRAALADLETATRREAGCVSFTFFQALSAEDHFLLIEDFVGAADLEAHMQQPHTRAFFARNLVERIEAMGKDWLS